MFEKLCKASSFVGKQEGSLDMGLSYSGDYEWFATITHVFDSRRVHQFFISLLVFVSTYIYNRYRENMRKHIRSKEEYEKAIKNAHSIAEALRNLGIVDVGGNYRIIKQAIKDYGIDISHFTGQGWNVGLKFNPAKHYSNEEAFVENSTLNSNNIRRRLIQSGIKECKCEFCGRTEWEGKSIPLELHHINGNNTDNRLENLQILCPNCHALTDNYRGRKNKKIKDNEITKKNKEKTIKSNSLNQHQKETKRPSKEELEKLIHEKPFLQIGRMYGVSDNAVRKWCKRYGLKHRKKDIK